jgi:hypothetical protein
LIHQEYSDSREIIHPLNPILLLFRPLFDALFIFSLINKGGGPIQYKHALFLNPYTESNATNAIMLFPAVCLEYVATGAKGYVDKIT